MSPSLRTVVFLSLLAAPALAQEAAPADASRVFEAEEFARFAPRTALDMLRQTPGFVIREASDERGIGEASGNVLLNGQRLAGKSDDILAQLGRVPAQNVVRIEILDGATLNIPGLSGQVANVVARAGVMSGQFSWRPEFRSHFTRPLFSRFNVSASGVRGPVEFTFGMENNSSHSGAGGPTNIHAPTGELIEFRDEIWTGEFEQPRISGRFAIDGPGSSLANLNLSYRRFWYDYEENGTRVGPGLVDRDRTVVEEEDGYDYEVGGDVEFPFGPGRLKLIGLNRFTHSEPVSAVVTSFADGRPDAGDRFERIGDERELVVRGEYMWKLGKADWQVSAEGAFNSLDNAAALFSLAPDGSYAEVPLPGGTARVEEDRYEAVASYGRPLSPSLSVQIALGAEYSQLSQIGGGGLVREFWRPKGEVNAAWKASPATDVNFRLRRSVGQLDFFDFLASVNLTDNTQNAGNPNLEPPQSWEAEVETTHGLGAWGSTTLRVYGHLIEDIVDIVPIGPTGESIGNIDRAIRYGGEWKSTINFDAFGWRGAKLDTVFQLQRSRVDDPLTGESREISDSLIRFIDITFRHDVPGTDWAWGGDTVHEKLAQNYRLSEFGRVYEGPVWQSVFIENKDVFGLTVRAAVNNIAGGRSRWNRTVFVDRRTGPAAFVENRDRLIGPIFSLQVGGRF